MEIQELVQSLKSNWKQFPENEWKNKPDVHWCSKSIKCVEDDKIFHSITEAAKYYNCSVTSINNILQGRAKNLRNGKSFVRN